MPVASVRTKSLREPPRAVRLPVRTTPRAGRAEVRGVENGELVVAVTAPPVDGAANAALVDFIAKQFHLPKGAVTIERGLTARHKLLRIEGMTAEQAREAFGIPLD